MITIDSNKLHTIIATKLQDEQLYELKKITDPEMGEYVGMISALPIKEERAEEIAKTIVDVIELNSVDEEAVVDIGCEGGERSL